MSGFGENELISVILPTYNRGALLLRSIQSVLAQTWENFELILVDDGSTDDTPALASTIGDGRFRYVRLKQNMGACAARNRGVALARGEYIAFQDSDDVWAPGKLFGQMAFLQKTGADIVFCSFRRHTPAHPQGEVLPRRERTGPIEYEELLCGSVISTQTILGKRACFAGHPFDETFPRMQDWELMLRLTRLYTVLHGDQSWVDMYVQKDSISQNSKAGLEALMRLRAMHSDALAKNPAAARHFATATGAMMRQCHQNPWRSYWSFMAPGLGLPANAYLFARGILSRLTGR